MKRYAHAGLEPMPLMLTKRYAHAGLEPMPQMLTKRYAHAGSVARCHETLWPCGLWSPLSRNAMPVRVWSPCRETLCPCGFGAHAAKRYAHAGLEAMSRNAILLSRNAMPMRV